MWRSYALRVAQISLGGSPRRDDHEGSNVRATPSLPTAVLLLHVIGCSAMLPPALPEPDVVLALGDAVLLTW